MGIKTTNQSSAEVEVIAASTTSKILTWTTNILEEIGIKVKKSVIINCDNQATIKIAQSEGLTPRAKHIDIRTFTYAIKSNLEIKNSNTFKQQKIKRIYERKPSARQVQEVTRSTERRRLHQALHEWERWNQANIRDRWDTQQVAAVQGYMQDNDKTADQDEMDSE